MTEITKAALASSQQTNADLVAIQQTGWNPPEVEVALDINRQQTAAIHAIQDPPPPVKNVQFYGAVADGISINNAAFAKAVASGEVLIDTAGVYLLDGVNAPFDVTGTGTKLRVTVPGVVFKCKPNNQSRYYVVRVTGTDCDCDFADAMILGDRDQHAWEYDPDGKWHEHGYGLWVGGLRNKVYGRVDEAHPFGSAVITKCTGDGIGTKGAGHDISGFVCDQNRRQGLSAFDCANVSIHNNTFQNTGPYAGVPDPLGLTNPFAGIDVEPDKGNVSGLKIFNNLIAFNRKSGLTVWVRAEVNTKIDVEIFGNVIRGNTNGINMKDAAVRAPTITANIHNNTFENNSGNGIRADQGSSSVIGHGTDKSKANIFDALRERTDIFRVGKISPEVATYLGARATVGWNAYV
jgi:hypothetical protein